MKSIPVNHDKMADISPNTLVSSIHILAPMPTTTDQTAAALYPQSSDHGLERPACMALIMSVIAILNRQYSLWLLYHCGPLLAKDASVAQGMQGANIQFMGLCMLVHPFSLLLEGTVLSLKQFPTLVWMYIGTMALHFSVSSPCSVSILVTCGKPFCFNSFD